MSCETGSSDPRPETARSEEAPWELRRRELLTYPPERVWKALTSPGELTAWFCERSEIDLRQGGKLAFFGNSVYSVPGSSDPEIAARPGNFEITALEETELIEFRWWIGSTETRVRIELAPHLMQTELGVIQSAREDPGWPAGDGDPNWWWVALPALRSYLETGRPHLRMDYPALRKGGKIRFQVGVTTFPWFVWDKLSTAEELARWWGRDPLVELREGGVFCLDSEVGRGPSRVLELTPQERLVHDWRREDGTVGRIEWRIEETDDDTLLSVTDHGPWSPSTDRDRVGLYWASSILHLKHLSEKGITPREQQFR